MTVDREKLIEGLQKTLMWADTPELLEGMSPKELYNEYECWRPEAEAVLKYFEEQGLVIVPVEPTKEMCWAWQNPDLEISRFITYCDQPMMTELWKAMIQSVTKGGSDD